MELLERGGLLEELNVLLAEAAARQGRLAFVSGEAGIGKSSLLHRFLHTVSPDIPALLGACDPLPTPRPLGPLLDMAPELPTEVAALLDGGRRDDVFRALHAHLRARATPLVLAFEDVHWADEATLDLLRFLGRRLEGVPALLLATFRDDEVGNEHPLRLLLGDMAASAHSRRLRLPPLSTAAVAQLAQGTAFDTAELHGVTRGNPFFVTEILAAGTGLPDSVRDAVLARVARLPSAARPYLAMAAVIGDRIELQLLEDTVAAPREGLDACLASGVLQASGVPPLTLSFRHELARRALLDALPPTRRRQLHVRLLAALTPAPGKPAPDSLALLAHHAEGAGDRDAVLRYAPAAARRARELAAHREAAAQFARALRFAAGLPDDERADLLTAFARESETIDRLDDAARAYREALALWRRRGDREREGLTLALLVQSLVLAGHNEEAEAASRESLTLLQGLPPGPALARATAVQALLRMLHRDGVEAVRWSERAIDMAERLDDRELQARATNVLGASLIVAGEMERGREQLERSLELARADSNPAGVAVALSNLGSAMGEMHRFIAANDYLERAVAYSNEHDLEANRSYSLSWLALTRMHLGHWSEATSAAQEVLARPHAAISHIMAHLAIGRLRARRGDPEVWGPLDAALALAEPTGTLQRLAPVRAARAEAAWLAGDPAGAAAEASAAYEMAAQRRHAWFVGELAYWRWKGGDVTAAPANAAEPYALQMAGRAREAAAAWQALGCPYEAARALSESADEGDLRQAQAAFEALAAGPMLARLRSALGATTAAPETPFVRLLGSPQIRFESVWHQPPFGKTAALLYYLAYHGDWLGRDELILLLWPDVSEKRARASLRNLLSHTARKLRYATGLEIEPRRVRWQVDSDAGAYLAAVGRGDPDSSDLYRGSLLDGFHPPDLPEFERWLETERSLLASGWRSALLERARTLANDDPGGAAGALAPLLTGDDLDEDIVRLEMRYLHAARRSLEALERYRRFADRLHSEIGAEPGEVTAALARSIRQELT